MFDLPFLLANLPTLIWAAGATVVVTTLGMAVALAFGLALALIQLDAPPALGRTTGWLTQCVRVTPLLIQLYFVFYVLPVYGVVLPAFLTAVLVIGIHYATYTSEIFKAGFGSIPSSQSDAIIALNIAPTRAWTRILLPQATIPMVPSLGNCAIAMLKESPLLSVITIPELVGVGRQLAFFTFKYVEVFTALGVIFLLLSVFYAVIVRWIERLIRIPA